MAAAARLTLLAGSAAAVVLLIVALAGVGRAPAGAAQGPNTGSPALRRRRLDGGDTSATTQSPFVGKDPGDAHGPPAGADASGNYKGYTVFRATPSQEGHLKLLKDDALSRAGLMADVWAEARNVGAPVDLMLPGADAAKAIKYFEANGIAFRTMIHDVQNTIDATHPLRREALLQTLAFAAVGNETTANANETVSARKPTFLDQYQTFENITEWMERTAKDHPKIASVVVVGDTYENRTIKGMRITNGDGKKPAIFIMCGIHAREWIGPASCLYVIDQLVRSSTRHGKDATFLIDTFEWHIVPVVNADGYVYTWTTDRLWRKTRKPQGGGEYGCVGADPNRNFDFHRCIEPMSNYCFTQTYCGDAAFSEECVKHIAEYLENLNKTGTEIRSFVDIHSYSQMWMWPWGWTTDDDADQAAQAKCGHATVDALGAVHGTEFMTGPIAQTIYEVGGSSTDWAYGVMNIKYAYAVELRDQGEYGFLLPEEEIRPSGEELMAGLNAMATCMDVGK